MEINKRYKFGNTVFRIKSSVEMLEDEKFEAFLAVDEEQDDYIYEVIPMEVEKGNPTVKIERNGKYIKVFVGEKYIPKITIANLFSAAETGKLLPEKNAVILHASYIIYGGQAILFCAPSGTGKSTQANFWKEKKDTFTVNEDRVIITQQNGIYYAEGCWAMGQAKICHNVSVPIKAIVLLEQGTENVIKKEHPAYLLKRIVPQCTFDDKDANQCSQIIDMVFNMIANVNVNVVVYSCINDISSVDVLEKYLCQK